MDPYLKEKYAEYEPTTQELPSTRELVESLDERFLFFLRQKSGERVSTWKQIIQNRPLSAVIGELVVGCNLTDEEPLTAERYKDLVLKMHGCINSLTNGNYPQLLSEATEAQCTVIEILGQMAFKSQSISIKMMYDFEGFFIWLIENNFRVPEKRRQERENRLRLSTLSYAILDLMYAATIILKNDPKKAGIIHHSLLKLIQTCSEPDVLEAIYSEIDATTENETDFFNETEKAFNEHAPDCWISTVIEEKIKVVLLEREGFKPVCSIVPPDNFYFTDCECDDIESPEGDEFPEMGALCHDRDMYRELIGGKDCSVFTQDGRKVYWGDLSQKDVEKLTGTYYVLTQSHSIHNVPEMAVLIKSHWPALEPDAVPNSERLSPRPNDIPCLDTDYIKLVAECKIKDGKVIPNNKTITGYTK